MIVAAMAAAASAFMPAQGGWQDDGKQILLPDGTSWRGRIGDRVAVEFEEGGVRQRLEGTIVSVSRRLVQIEGQIAGREAIKTILTTDLRSLESVGHSQKDQVEELQRPLGETGVALSAGVESVERFLADARAPRSLVLVIDVGDLNEFDVQRLLHAIDDGRRRRLSIRVACGSVSGGAAAVALAGEALVVTEDAVFSAAPSGWSRSPSRRERLVAHSAELGGFDRSLAEAIFEAGGELSWSAESGFLRNGDGEVRIARSGSPLRMDAERILEVGLAAAIAPDLDAAVAMADSEGIETRSGAASRRSAQTTDTPADVSPSPSGDRASTPAAIAAIAEHDQALARLVADIEEFDLYFTGRKGVWTAAPNLRVVWEQSSGMTRHVDTQTATQRLARAMKQSIGTMQAAGRRLQVILGEQDHRLNRHHRSMQATLDGLDAALSRNRAVDYIRHAAEVKRLKSLASAGS